MLQMYMYAMSVLVVRSHLQQPVQVLCIQLCGVEPYMSLPQHATTSS